MLPELAREPALPATDGVLTEGAEGREVGLLGTETAGAGGVGTGGVVTVPAGVGTVALGTVVGSEGTDGVGTLGPVAPAAGAATSRPEAAAETARVFLNMISGSY